MENKNIFSTRNVIFLLVVILIFTLFLTTNIKAGGAKVAPTFTTSPAHAPDPVDQGNPVTFTATANDNNGDAWWLVICTTSTAPTGNDPSPPTCAATTYCASSSSVASDTQNTCDWTSTGSGAQNYFGFACDITDRCSAADSTNSPLNVNVPPTDNAPIVTLSSPIDYFNTTITAFTFTGTASDDLLLQNITIYGDWNGGWHANETNSTPVNDTATSFSKTISDGTYLWNYYACDNASQCSFATSNRTFTLDTIPPTWTDPSATSAGAGNQVYHNVSWSDVGGDLSWATLEVNGTGASCSTTANVTNITLSGTNQFANLSWTVPAACEGKAIGWRQYANDSANGWNTTDLQEYSVPIIPPTAAFGTNPVDTLNSSSPTVSFDLSCSDNANVDTIILYGNWSGNWVANQTNSTGVNDTVWTVSVGEIPDGLGHIWGVWCNDTLGNEDWSDTNRTLNIDTTMPLVTINDPQNQSYITNSILFNVTATDIVGINSCGYTFDGGATNYTLTNNDGDFWDDTNVSMNQGQTNVIFACNDSFGNLNGTMEVAFFVDSIIPQIDFISPTENNGTSFNRQWIYANVSLTETNFQNITFTLYNSTGEVNQIFRTTENLEINWTGLSNDGVLYWYNVSTYDSVGNYNVTSDRYISLTSDQPPQSSSYVESPADSSAYSVGASYQFNTTWTDDNGVSVVWIEHNFTGVLTNYTPPNISTVWYYDYTDLAADYYVWRMYANDTIDVWNSTDQFNYTVTQNTDSCNVLFNESSGITYPATFNVSTDCTTAFTLTRNGTTITNNTEQILAASAYNFSVQRTDTVNYSNTVDEAEFSISQAIPTGSLTNNESWIVTYPTSVTINLTESNSGDEDLNYYVWRDGVNKSSFGESVLLGVGGYSYNLNTTGGYNYTLNASMYPQTLIINQNTGNCQVLFNISSPITFPATFRVYTDCNSDAADFTLRRNGTIVTNNSEQSLAASAYNFSVQRTDTVNYSNTYDDAEFRITPDLPPYFTTIPSNVSGTYGTVNVNADFDAADAVSFGGFYLNDTSDFSIDYVTGILTNNSPLFVGNYALNVTINDSIQNINWTIFTVVVSQATPALSLVLTPSNSETYGTETNATGSNCSSQLTCILYRDGVALAGETDVSTLAAGVYNYTYNTTGNANYTVYTNSSNLTIAQSADSCNVLFNESSGITYPATFNVSTDCTTAFTLTRNGTTITNNTEQALAASAYNFSVQRIDTVNYSNTVDEAEFSITKGTGSVFTYIDNSRSNLTMEQFTVIYLNGTLETGSGNIQLYINDTLSESGSSPLSNLSNFSVISLYNITTLYSGNENYTSAFETWWLNVTEADVISPTVAVQYPVTGTNYSVAQTELNYTASDNFGLNECWYSLNEGASNSTPDPSCSNFIVTSVEGSNTWTVYANDDKGNENSSSVTFLVDTIYPTVTYVSPTETSEISFGRNFVQVNVTASDDNLDTITIYLYDSDGLERENTSTTSLFSINYTDLPAGNYSFNVTVNDTSGNAVSLTTRNVSLIVPSLTIINPDNATYISNISLPLDFAVSYEDFVWYTNDSDMNVTVTGNTTFNISEGQKTLYLYANNSNGETSKNVTFFVNNSRLNIIYDEFKITSTKGNSTRFENYSYTELQNLSRIILENTSAGRIEFSVALNLTNDITPNDDILDLDTNVNISDNSISLDSVNLPNFNQPATLFLYNLTFSNPRVLKDGIACLAPICTEVGFSGGTLEFTVTQFSEYSTDETPSDVTPGPGGGGGARGFIYECLNDSQCTVADEVCWENKCVQLFDIKIIEFESPVKLGEFFDFTYFVKGMADISDDVEISFWIEKDGEVISSGSDTIYIGSFEEKTESTKIFLPSSVESGIYTFNIEVIHDDYVAKSHRTIEIAVDDKIAFISPAKPDDFKPYLIVLLTFMALLILSLIFYIERRRVVQGIQEEARLIMKYKLTILVSLLILLFGFVIFYFNLLLILSRVIRQILPFIYYIFLFIFISILIAFIIIFSKKTELISKWKKLLEKRRIEKRLKNKYKEKSKQSKKIFKKKQKKKEWKFPKLEIHPWKAISSFFGNVFGFFKIFGLNTSKQLKVVEKGTLLETKKTIEKVEKVFVETSGFIKDRGESIEKKLKVLRVPKIKLPKFTLPKFKLPTLKAPRFDKEKALLKKSDLVLKKGILSTEKEFRSLRVPKLKIKLPKFKLPKIKLPKINLPSVKLPKFSLPKIKVKIPKLKTLKLPKLRFKLPSFKLPKLKQEKDFIKREEKWLKQKDIILRKKIKEDEKKFKKLKASKLKLLRFKLPKIKLPKINLPSVKLPKFSLPKIGIKTPKISVWVSKIKVPKFKLPKINLPSVKLPKLRFKLPSLPESRLTKEFDKIDFTSKKIAIRKEEVQFEDFARKSLKATREIYKDIHKLLIKVFGAKSHKQLVEDFEKYFVNEGKFTRRHSNALGEIISAVKKFESGKIEHHGRHKIIRKNATIFINDLFSHLKSNKLIHPVKEFKGMEKKIKNYSRQLNSTALFSRKMFRNTKDALRRSDKVIHSTIDNVQELHNNMWEAKKRQNEIKLKKGFFENRFESKGKTAKRLADEVSREVKDSSKDHEMKDIIEDMADKEKKE